VAGGSTSSEEITVSHPPTYGDRLSTAVIVEERRNGPRTMRLPDLTLMLLDTKAEKVCTIGLNDRAMVDLMGIGKLNHLLNFQTPCNGVRCVLLLQSPAVD